MSNEEPKYGPEPESDLESESGQDPASDHEPGPEQDEAAYDSSPRLVLHSSAPSEEFPDSPTPITDELRLSRLLQLAAKLGQWDRLIDLAEACAAASPREGREQWVLAAHLYEKECNDLTSAIAAWCEVQKLNSADREALDELERLYGLTSEAHKLAQVLESKLKLINKYDERQRLRRTAAKLYEEQLAAPERAIEKLKDVLSEDNNDTGVLAELERIYTHRKMWEQLVGTLDQLAGLAPTAAARADYEFRAVSLVVKHELENIDNVILRFQAVLSSLPGHTAARAALDTLVARKKALDILVAKQRRMEASTVEPAPELGAAPESAQLILPFPAACNSETASPLQRAQCADHRRNLGYDP